MIGGSRIVRLGGVGKIRLKERKGILDKCLIFKRIFFLNEFFLFCCNIESMFLFFDVLMLLCWYIFREIIVLMKYVEFGLKFRFI